MLASTKTDSRKASENTQTVKESHIKLLGSMDKSIRMDP